MFIGKKSVHRSLLVCVNGFCGSSHLDESTVTNATDKALFAGRATFVIFLIGVCSNIWWLLLQINAICWHGKAIWNVVLGVHNQLFFVKPFIHLNKIFQYTLPWWEWYYSNSISVSKVYLTYCGHNGVLEAKLYALTAYNKPTGIDDITYEVWCIIWRIFYSIRETHHSISLIVDTCLVIHVQIRSPDPLQFN